MCPRPYAPSAQSTASGIVMHRPLLVRLPDCARTRLTTKTPPCQPFEFKYLRNHENLVSRYYCEPPMMDMDISLSASRKVGASQAAEYSWRPPSPPRIHVPPQREEDHIVLHPYDGVDGKDLTDEDLKILTQGNTTCSPSRPWEYSDRRNAQPILPFLYLGPSSAARDIDALRSQGITMLLVVRDTIMAQARMLSGEKVAQQLGIEAACIDVSGQQELIAVFPRAIKLINDHLIRVWKESGRSRWGKVLVFCESGNERSACVVAAYLMHMHRTNLIEAIQYIHARRFCVALDDGHKNLLLSYHQILDAKRALLPTQNENTQPNTHPKRGRDDINMDDGIEIDGETADDEARFHGRHAFVPFR